MHFEKHSLEVRGLASNFHFEEYLCHSFGANGKENAYLRMPLFPYSKNDFAFFRKSDEEKFLKTKPNIAISKIILGYNYSDKRYEELRYLIFRLSKKVFGKYIQTEKSSLAQYL